MMQFLLLLVAQLRPVKVCFFSEKRYIFHRRFHIISLPSFINKSFLFLFLIHQKSIFCCFEHFLQTSNNSEFYFLERKKYLQFLALCLWLYTISLKKRFLNLFLPHILESSVCVYNDKFKCFLFFVHIRII